MDERKTRRARSVMIRLVTLLFCFTLASPTHGLSKPTSSRVTTQKKSKTKRYRSRNARGKKAKYRLKRRRKAGGTYGKNRTLPKTTRKTIPTKRKTRSGEVRQTKRKTRRGISKTDLMLLQWQTQILLSDPVYGRTYRKLLKGMPKPKK